MTLCLEPCEDTLEAKVIDNQDLLTLIKLLGCSGNHKLSTILSLYQIVSHY